MNRPASDVNLDEPMDKVEVNPENIRIIVEFLEPAIKNSFDEYQNSFSLLALKMGLPLRYSYKASQVIPMFVRASLLHDPNKLEKIIDDFLLMRGRNEGIIAPNQSLQEFFERLQR